jgi:hypothetical protein
MDLRYKAFMDMTRKGSEHPELVEGWNSFLPKQSSFDGLRTNGFIIIKKL